MTHRQKELVKILLKQAGYKEEGRMYVNYPTKSAIGIKELFPEQGDDSELWDEAFTNAPVRLHPLTEGYLRAKYKLSRK